MIMNRLCCCGLTLILACTFAVILLCTGFLMYVPKTDHQGLTINSEQNVPDGFICPKYSFLNETGCFKTEHCKRVSEAMIDDNLLDLKIRLACNPRKYSILFYACIAVGLAALLLEVVFVAMFIFRKPKVAVESEVAA
ncbi:unnamed protein product, partial [Mesorhabditis spiculigera]